MVNISCSAPFLELSSILSLLSESPSRGHVVV